MYPLLKILLVVTATVGTIVMAEDPLLSPDYKNKPTIRPYHPLDPVKDAIHLRKAMEGLGTDEEAIIGIMTRRTEDQRLLIEEAYKAHFSRSLIDDFEHELSGTLEDAIVGLLQGTNLFLATQLHRAVHSSDEETLADIIGPRSYEELVHIVTTYDQKFEKPLHAELAKDKSSLLRRLLLARVSVCNSSSSDTLVHETTPVGIIFTTISPLFNSKRTLDPLNPSDPKKDAEVLYNAGKGLIHADENALITILTERSDHQLRNVFKEYGKKAHRSIEETIRAEYSGPMKTALLAIVEAAQNRAVHFAKRLHRAMYGAGTDEDTLTRILVTRAEIDLFNIKLQYERLYDHTLASDIEHETSRHYESTLLSLLG